MKLGDDNRKRAVIPALLVALTVSSYAESGGWSAGVGLSAVKTVCVGECEENTFGFMGKINYDIDKFFGFEGRVIKTLDFEEEKVEHVAIFAKPNFPLSKNLNLYGLFGYGNTKLKGEEEIKDLSIAWAAGFSYSLEKSELVGENVSLFVDGGRLYQKRDEPDVYTLNFGLSYRF